MTRFVAPDLSALDGLPLVTLDYEATEARRLGYYVAALDAHGIAYDVAGLETDPMRVALSQGGAYVEMLLDQRITNAIESLSLVTATGAALDHIGATYYGVSRQSTVVDDVIVPEADERFRARIALAPEAFSTAGPEGAYAFHALEVDGRQSVADVAVYGEEDGATYSVGTGVIRADAYTRGVHGTTFDREDGDDVTAPEVLVVIAATAEYGAIDQALVDKVWDAVSADDVRPIGDLVTVEAASVQSYAVTVTITSAPGADVALLAAEAKRRIEAYVAARRRVGLAAQVVGIGGAAQVDNALSVTVTSPTADVGGGPKQLPHCTGVTVNTAQSNGSWT